MYLYNVYVVMYPRICSISQRSGSTTNAASHGASTDECSVLQVLDVIAPPYTHDFVQLFLPLIENEDITGSLRTNEEDDPISEFICECMSSDFLLNHQKIHHSGEMSLSSQCVSSEHVIVITVCSWSCHLNNRW